MLSSSRSSSDTDGDDERGAGGKLVRRRRAGAVTPYQRPEDGRRGWLSGIVAGAGRLVSAVFRSGGPDEEDDKIKDDSEDSQDETNLQSDEEHQMDTSEPLVAKSAAKLVIEQLILKEKFTRSECDRLIEIIRTRVVDFPITGGDDGIPNDLHNVSPQRNSIYSRSLLSTELCSEAVLEAKKWVEGKRSATSLKASQNFEVLHHWDDASDQGTPVDMAKSYMQALPPWLSPVSTSGFRSPSIRACSENIESSYAISSPALSALQDLKRKCASVGPSDDHNAIRSLHKKSCENFPDSPAFGLSASSNKLLEHECQQTTVVIDGKAPEELPIINESAAPATCSLEATTSVPMESDRTAVFSNEENADKISLPLDNGVFMEATLSTLPLESEVQISSSRQEILIAEKNQELDGFALSKELIDNVVPQDNHLSTLHMEHKGLVEDFMNAEPISMVPENDNPTLPGGDAITIDVTELPRGSEHEDTGRESNHSQPDSFTPPETVHTDISDFGPLHETDKETITSESVSAAVGVSSIPSSSLAGSKEVGSTSKARPDEEAPIPKETANRSKDVDASGDVNGPSRYKTQYKTRKSITKPHRQLRKETTSKRVTRGTKTPVQRQTGGRGRGRGK